MEYLELDEEQSIELIRNTVRLAHIAKERYLAECYQAQLSVPEGECTFSWLPGIYRFGTCGITST